MQPPARFSSLDGLRGVAAIAVLFFHGGKFAPLPMPGGYLAVDLFFALSGFVIALAYEERLREGMTLRQFAVARAIRVYPMYLVGLMIGRLYVEPSPQNWLMLPSLSYPDEMFRVNVPMWSLFFEMIVNLAFAALAVRIGRRGLKAILVSSGAILVGSVIARGGGSLDLGGNWDGAGIGLARTVFSFTLGVAIFRLRRERLHERRTDGRALLLYPALVAALAFDPASRGAWDLACVFVFLPALLWFGTQWETPVTRLTGALGDMSYPLYCIHSQLIWRTGDTMAQVSLGLIVAAWALDRFLDRPLRKVLTLMIREMRPRPQPA